jgi:hypothetical protein
MSYRVLPAHAQRPLFINTSALQQSWQPNGIGRDKTNTSRSRRAHPRRFGKPTAPLPISIQPLDYFVLPLRPTARPKQTVSVRAPLILIQVNLGILRRSFGTDCRRCRFVRRLWMNWTGGIAYNLPVLLLLNYRRHSLPRILQQG